MNFISSYVFQVAILSALALAIGDFLQLSFVLYILFGFWVSFSPSIGEGIEGASKQLLGIGGGGFIACAIMLNLSQNTLSVGIGLFLTILFCYAIGIPKSVGGAIGSFCMVSIGHYSDGLSQYYWERFIENSIGVAFG
ncbi:MAG: FUSC family protein, partial [Cyanobacteriota bacterium]|nr:FUSC family protein [Cyanobacteriota bacterium]